MKLDRIKKSIVARGYIVLSVALIMLDSYLFRGAFEIQAELIQVLVFLTSALGAIMAMIMLEIGIRNKEAKAKLEVMKEFEKEMQLVKNVEISFDNYFKGMINEPELLMEYNRQKLLSKRGRADV